MRIAATGLRAWAGAVAGLLLAWSAPAASAQDVSHVEAIYRLAGDGDAEALAELRALVDAGDSEAQTYLAIMYEDGWGVEQDIEEARRLYRLAAEQGHTIAANLMASTYGWREAEEQIRWYRLAADLGDPSAQFMLGLMYGSDLWVEQDYVESMRWHRAASGQGFSDSTHALAMMYSQGLGVPADAAEAERLFGLWEEQQKAETPIVIDWAD